MTDDYRAALALLTAGVDTTAVHHETGVSIEVLWGLADALDGEAAGAMYRFGSVIDPRYRPANPDAGRRLSDARRLSDGIVHANVDLQGQ